MLLKGKELNQAEVAEIAVATVKAAAALPKFRVIGVNSLSLNNAGAYCSQELGYALAWGAEYMTMLTEGGLTADEAGKAIKFIQHGCWWQLLHGNC